MPQIWNMLIMFFTRSLSRISRLLPVFLPLVFGAVLHADPAQPDNPGGGSGRTLYLDAENGSNSNSGLSESTAWAGFQYAIDNAEPGDTVLVMNGDYYERASETANWRLSAKRGAPDAYTTFRAYPGHTPTFYVDTWNGIEVMWSHYVEIDGFEIRGRPDPVEIIGKPDNDPARKEFAVMSQYQTQAGNLYAGNAITVAQETHHIRIRNCHIHTVGGNGIAIGSGNIVLAENNRIWHAGHRSDAGNSGLSVAGLRSTDAVRPVNYGAVLRGNIIHDINNFLGFKHYLDGQFLTDGNGIIVDWGNAHYTDRTLVANNIVFNNGGRGVHAYASSFADFVHNTSYHNNQSIPPVSSTVHDGEISSVGLNRDINIFNNLAVARKDRRPFKRQAPGNPPPLPLDELGRTENNIFIFDPDDSERDMSIDSWRWPRDDRVFNSALNQLIPDPQYASLLFANPSRYAGNADFRLLPNSAAVGAGLTADPSLTAGPTDLAGRPRSALAGFDAGALQLGSGPQTVTVTVEGGNGSGTYAVGSMIPVEAEPAPTGRMFHRWRGNITRLNSVYSSSTHLLVPDHDVLLRPQYKDYEQVPPVVLSLPGGIYSQPIELSFTAPMPGVFILFTLDGSEPTRTNGIQWLNQGSLTISQSTIVRVMAWGVDYADSEVTTTTYDLDNGTANFVQLTVDGGTGSGTYLQGSVVQVRANPPAYGFRFAGWTGNTDGLADVTAALTTFTVGADPAHIEPLYESAPFYSLTVSNGTGTGQYPEGYAVTITADPAVPGMVFDRWAGDIGALADAAASTTTATVTDADVTVTALYTIGRTVTVEHGSGSGFYKAGTVLTIMANADPQGMLFSRWTGNVEVLQDPYSRITVLVVPAADVAIRALYVDIIYHTVVVEGGEGSGIHADGTMVTVTANSAPASHVFTHWTGDIGYLADPMAATTSFTATADMQLKAHYAPAFIIEAEALEWSRLLPDQSIDTEYDVFKRADASGGFIVEDAQSEGSIFRASISDLPEGHYNLIMRFRAGNDRGRVNVFVNGLLLHESLDLYGSWGYINSPGGWVQVTDTQSLLVEFVVLDRNPLATGSKVSIDNFSFIELETTAGYAAWASLRWPEISNLSVTGMYQDPENIGHIMLLNYAFGGDPIPGARPEFPMVHIIDDGSLPRQLGVLFTKVADPELEYTVEASNNLDPESWIAIETIYGDEMPEGPVFVPDVVEISPGNPRFFRVHVRPVTPSSN